MLNIQYIPSIITSWFLVTMIECMGEVVCMGPSYWESEAE